MGYKTQLMDISLADITAAGAQTGVEVWKECDLNLQTTLQKAILLTPADMVIYAGGPTDGAGVVKGTNLPETGFFITLPLEAETALRTALNTQEPSDLTPYLTFTDIDHNEWKLVWFHDDHPKVYGRFLYLLRPKDDPLDQTRFELQFYDPAKGTNIRQSDFQITDALQQAYKMTIFPGDHPASHPRGVLRVGDKELGSYALDVIPGTLFVRGTTKHLRINDIELGNVDFTGDRVVTCSEQNGVTYCINETMLPAHKDNVKLLVDHIVGGTYGATLRKMAGDVIEDIQADVQNPLQYQYRYLDLVDTSMGNAWVTVNKPVEIVWRYPDGADREDDFTIIHYKDLDRNYNLSDLERLELGKDYKLEVFTTRELGENTERITYHRLERGEKGLTFSTKSFSPYVLIWEGKPASQPDQGSGPVRTDRPSRERRAEAPEPPAAVPPELLSTDEHHAYLVGRGEGGVQPLAHITRGEVAAIWFRLLTDEARAAHWSTDDRYPDVGPALWCRNAIATMTSAGVLRGDEQGNYRPGDAITRAEFTAAAVRFFQAPQAETGIPFSDVPASAWYAEAVRDGAALGLITGGGDGAFRPNDPITRAEAAAIVNRMLGRKPHSGALPEHTAQWADNPMDAWYYGDMLEATVSHTCEWLEGESTEHWTGPLETRDWNALERFGPDGAARA